MVRRVDYGSIEPDRNTHDTAEAQIDVSCHCKRGYRNSIAHHWPPVVLGLCWRSRLHSGQQSGAATSDWASFLDDCDHFLVYAIFAECPVLWTGMNASGEVRGGDAIPSLAQCREAALLSKSERKLRRFAPRCPDLWSGSFTGEMCLISPL